MPSLVASIFRLENDKGYLSPKIDIQYMEKDTGVQWTINCGGTRVYLIRFGQNLDADLNDQSADSHFMVNRIITSLFLSGCGLFRAKAMGRLFINNIDTSAINVTTHLDLWDKMSEEINEIQIADEFRDWYQFICGNVLFRRAADDAYQALLNPVEVIFYIYRGMEWLLQAADIGWRELAQDIGVSFNDIKKFKRQINYESGERHGIKSGLKRRSIAEDYGALVADFIYGLCNVRKRVDDDFSGISTEKAAEIVMKAMPLVPYP